MGYLVLCAYDGSAAADRAFDFAAILALRFQGSVHTLAVAQPTDGMSGRDTKALFEAGMMRFQPKFERLRLKGAGAGVEQKFELCLGYPPHQILHRAGELQVDHIVIGHQGKSAMQRWELGSVAQRIVMHASVLVTVVP